MSDDNIAFLLENLRDTDLEVVRDDDGWNFYQFNREPNLSSFKSSLSLLYHCSMEEIRLKISRLDINPDNYKEGLIMQIDDVLEEFTTVDNLLIKKNLNITNLRGDAFDYERISPECKKTILDFIAFQKEITEKFLRKLKKPLPSANTENIKWVGNKTDLVEMSLALYHANVLTKDGRPVTRKECINFAASLFGEKIKDPNKVIAKLYERENPAAFLQRLTDLLQQSQMKRDYNSDI
jgi:hypothetical protein